MAGLADAKREALELLDVAVVDAWRRYARTCREAGSYETVEPWAWKFLQQQLRAIDARRRKLGKR